MSPKRLLLILTTMLWPAWGVRAEANVRPAVVASLASQELRDFERNPPAVRSLLESALALTRRNLTYRFGSADPAQGGMDCSGTIYYLLREAGWTDVPRTASEQYVWARKAGTFQAVVSRREDSFELEALRPGDLLFWTGTYATDRDPPVTHTMLYLGRRKRDGHPVMVGASDGRTYDGAKMWGVSVFDFRIPRAGKREGKSNDAGPGSIFVGYAPIPPAGKTGAGTGDQ